MVTIRMAAGSWRRALAAACLSCAAAACAPHTAADTGSVRAGAGAADGQARTDAVAFVDVDVLPMDRDVLLRGQTVVARDGRIVSVSPAAQAEVPAGALRIDGRGKVLMPGLTELHGHVPDAEDPQYLEDVLLLFLANGVTTVRSMSGDPSHIALRERLARGEFDGPTLIAASPWLNADSAEEIDRTLRAHREAGYDLVKIGSMPPALYPGMARTAHALGLPFAGHIPQDVGLEAALQARQMSIDHLDRYVEFLVPPNARPSGRDAGFFGSGWVHAVDSARIPEAVARTVEAGTWNVPTLSLVEHLASPEPAEEMIRWPEMRYMPQEVRDGWVRAKREFAARDDFRPDAAARLVQVRRQLLKALHDGGAPIALGSDAPQFFNVPGFSIHREMRMMEAAGLTPYQVLATGTQAPARYLGMPEAFGTVAPGRRADLVLLHGDPRQDLTHAARPAGVMARGRWWPESELRERLQAIARRREASVARVSE